MQNNQSKLLDYVKIKDYQARYAADIHDDLYFGFPVSPILEAEKTLLSGGDKTVAYFSMEYGLATNVYNVFQSVLPLKPDNRLSDNEIFSNDRVADFLFSLKIDAALDLPIYSGGLGVLAGDTVKTSSDLKVPMCAVGILWNKGYFKQRFWFKFGQLPEEMRWDPETFPGLIPLEDKVKLELNGRDIYLRIWKYYVFSRNRDFVVPLLLLDSNVEENDDAARRLTDKLYKSDDIDGRLLQRLILGMGGVKALEVLNYKIGLYHLNEGHAAFAFVQKASNATKDKYDELRSRFCYTCHTPVPAGHDRFPFSLLERIMKKEDLDVVKNFALEGKSGDVVNLTLLAMNTSRSINAVSQKHGDVMRLQFPHYKDRIKAITNGVHFHTWMSENMLGILDAYKDTLGDFRSDPTLLKNVLKLKTNEEFRSAVWKAHQENKLALVRFLDKWQLKKNALTLCWARRIAAYKRPSLIFQDIERLKDMANRIGPIQILYAGKAHPNDNLAFTYINDIMNSIDKAEGAEDNLKILMLENYDIYIAKMLVSSVDIWLNNPLPPYEASGTSGMKAISNGVLQLSTLDGWVLEASDKPVGNFFGHRDDGKTFTDGLVLRLDEDSQALYSSLEEMMLLYYDIEKDDKLNIGSQWIDMMIECIAESSFFNTHRMLQQYKQDVWGF